MRYANESRSGRLIDAETMHIPAYARYVCPCCSGEVHLRKGDLRTHHFAHNAGQGSPDCENYHPGVYTPDSRCTSRSGPASRPFVSLYVSVPDWRARNAPWQLQIRIPQAEDCRGAVIVQDGQSGRSTLPCSRLVNGPMRVAILPKAEPYCLRAEGIGDSEYARRIEEPVGGLERCTLNVFRFSACCGGRHLDRRHPLFWGRAYYIVNHRDSPVAIPAALNERALGKQGDWRATLVQLPDAEDEQLRSWVEQFLSRAIESPRIRLELVAPTRTEMPDEAIDVPVGQEVILGVTGPPGSHPPSELFVQFPGETEAKAFALPAKLPSLVSLGEISEGVTEAYLPNEWEAEITLVRCRDDRSDHRRLGPAAAELVVECTGYQGCVPLQSQRADATLREIKESRLQLKEIRLPKRLTVKLQTGKSGRYAERGEEVVLRPDIPEDHNQNTSWHSAFEKHVCAVIRKGLTIDRTDLQIDVGNFGCAKTFLLEPIEERREEVRLPASARRTALWILATSRGADNGKSPSASDGITMLDRFLRSKGGKSVNVEDVVILRSLVGLRSVSSALEPQMRALVRSL